MDAPNLIDVIDEWADSFSDEADVQEAFVDGVIRAVAEICIAELQTG